MFPYLRSLPVNFSKEGQRAKEGKVLYCMHTAAVENFRERNRKWKLSTLSTLAANSSQMSLLWCDIFQKDRSTETALE